MFFSHSRETQKMSERIIGISVENIKLFFLDVVVPHRYSSKNENFAKYKTDEAGFVNWLFKNGPRKEMVVSDFLEHECQMYNKKPPVKSVIKRYAERLNRKDPTACQNFNISKANLGNLNNMTSNQGSLSATNTCKGTCSKSTSWTKRN